MIGYLYKYPRIYFVIFIVQLNSMRKILKLLVVLLFTFFFSNNSQAQFKRPRALLFGNLAYASPNNDALKNNYSGGLAGELGAGLGLGKTMLVGSLGYQVYKSRSGVSTGNLRVLPVKVGIRQYVFGPLFAVANAGVAIQTYSNVENSGNTFLYELGAGLKLLSLLELQLTTNGWKQPNAPASSNALLFKVGWSVRL